MEPDPLLAKEKEEKKNIIICRGDFLDVLGDDALDEIQLQNPRKSQHEAFCLERSQVMQKLRASKILQKQTN